MPQLVLFFIMISRLLESCLKEQTTKQNKKTHAGGLYPSWLKFLLFLVFAVLSHCWFLPSLFFFFFLQSAPISTFLFLCATVVRSIIFSDWTAYSLTLASHSKSTLFLFPVFLFILFYCFLSL